MSKKEKNKIEKSTDPNDNLKAYKGSNAIIRWPYFLKALIIKYWYFGAMFYFIGFGIGLQKEYLALALGLIGGCFYDILIRHFLLALESDKREAKYHIMCAKKKYYSLPLNILYMLALSYCTFFICIGLSVLGAGSFGSEPFSYALIMLVVDILFLLAKWGISSLITHSKNKKSKEEVPEGDPSQKEIKE